MNKKTAKALEESIAHWERMRDDLDCEELPGESDCPLCSLFYDGVEEDCSECPIGKSANVHSCRNTPYAEARDAFYKLDDDNIGETLTVWRYAANKEIAFLESLRE